MPVLAINGPPTVSLSNDAEEAGLAADGAGLAAAGLAAAGAAGTARLASVKITVAAAIATKARLTSGFIGVPLMYLVEGSAAAPRPSSVRAAGSAPTICPETLSPQTTRKGPIWQRLLPLRTLIAAIRLLRARIGKFRL